MRFLPLTLVLAALVGLAVLGCASKTNNVAFGTVQVRLTDAPGEVQAVRLHLTGVSVHRAGDGEHDTSEGDTTEVEADDDTSHVDADDDTTDVEDGEHGDAGWENVTDDTMTVDLMALRNGVTSTLGMTPVPAGHYTQIRLKLGKGSNVVVDGVTYPLVVPSGMQSGLKLIHPFTVPRDGFVDVLLDFDAAHSLVQTATGAWMLKPTIKITTSNGAAASARPQAGTRTM